MHSSIHQGCCDLEGDVMLCMQVVSRLHLPHADLHAVSRLHHRCIGSAVPHGCCSSTPVRGCFHSEGAAWCQLRCDVASERFWAVFGQHDGYRPGCCNPGSAQRPCRAAAALLPSNGVQSLLLCRFLLTVLLLRLPSKHRNSVARCSCHIHHS